MKKYVVVLFVITIMGSLGLGGCGAPQATTSTPLSTPQEEGVVAQEACGYHDATKEPDTLCSAHKDAIKYLELYNEELRASIPNYEEYVEGDEYMAFVNAFWENFWDVHSCEVCESYR